MGLLLLALMIAVPMIEIAVFIEVGGRIGLGPTLVTVILTAVIGTALLRRQGLATLVRAQESMALGRFPVAEVFDGLCLLVAGALLLTPGFVTDAVGLLLFVPVVRAALRQALGRYLLASGRVTVWADGPEAAGNGGSGGGTVIDGDFQEVPEPRDGDGGGDSGRTLRPPDR